MKESAGQSGSLSEEDLQRAFPFLAAVGAEEIEVVPVRGDLAEEVVAVAELLQIEEFVFDQAVDGFDVALPGVALGRNEAVL
jgi:hypothetical protein